MEGNYITFWLNSFLQNLFKSLFYSKFVFKLLITNIFNNYNYKIISKNVNTIRECAGMCV